MGEFTGLVDLLGALFRLFGLEENALFPAVALLALFFIIAVPIGLLAQSRDVKTGKQGLVGSRGEALTDLAPSGSVYVHSEYWSAVADGEIPRGSKIVVVSVDGMTLKVARHS
jgi:membrane-bound serine protease (ClpP class)